MYVGYRVSRRGKTRSKPANSQSRQEFSRAFPYYPVPRLFVSRRLCCEQHAAMYDALAMYLDQNGPQTIRLERLARQCASPWCCAASAVLPVEKLSSGHCTNCKPDQQPNPGGKIRTNVDNIVSLSPSKYAYSYIPSSQTIVACFSAT